MAGDRFSVSRAADKRRLIGEGEEVGGEVGQGTPPAGYGSTGRTFVHTSHERLNLVLSTQSYDDKLFSLFNCKTNRFLFRFTVYNICFCAKQIKQYFIHDVLHTFQLHSILV